MIENLTDRNDKIHDVESTTRSRNRYDESQTENFRKCSKIFPVDTCVHCRSKRKKKLFNKRRVCSNLLFRSWFKTIWGSREISKDLRDVRRIESQIEPNSTLFFVNFSMKRRKFRTDSWSPVNFCRHQIVKCWKYILENICLDYNRNYNSKVDEFRSDHPEIVNEWKRKHEIFKLLFSFTFLKRAVWSVCNPLKISPIRIIGQSGNFSGSYRHEKFVASRTFRLKKDSNFQRKKNFFNWNEQIYIERDKID